MHTRSSLPYNNNYISKGLRQIYANVVVVVIEATNNGVDSRRLFAKFYRATLC